MASEEKVKDIDAEVSKNVLNIIRGFEREHESARDVHLWLHKKGDNFFRGHQHTYYDSEARDYRAFHESPDYDPTLDDEYNRVVNIYRAHGEAVIAALTLDVPGVNFLPDDTKSSEDLDTAKNFSAAALLIQRHNDAELLYANAVYTAWISPLVAAYHYLKADKGYGIVKEPQYGSREEKTESYECGNCGAKLSPEEDSCPRCDSTDINKLEHVQESSYIEDYEDIPKKRVQIDIYGVDNIKVSPFAKTQADTPYLILEFEEHISAARARTGREIKGGSDRASYERETRDPIGSGGDDSHRVTTQCVWLRPSAYYYEDLDKGDALTELYPNGLYIEYINDEAVEIRSENLDDYWTLWRSPLSKNIHANPLGQPLFDPQEIKNDIVNLSVETMSQAIPETFADPVVLDFNEYKKQRRTPGMLTQAKPAAGRSLQDAFYTTRTASMSQEIDKFDSKIDQMAQLAVGSFPSIYGGTLQGGSKTYAEYSASRQQALQRLSLVHKAATRWWSKVMARCVPMYVESLMEDEKYTQQIGPGDYLNLTIRADAMKGKIGHVEPSAANQLPMSWGQQRDVVIQLMQMKSPQIDAVLYSPENAHLLQRLSGLPELKIPGDDVRTKQFREILAIITTASEMEEEGIEGPPQSPIAIDPVVDDHATEAQVCRTFLQGKEGQELRESAPRAYAMIAEHMSQHIAAMNPNQGQPPGPSGESVNGNANRGQSGERPPTPVG
jgi:hypothetical protein